VKSWKRFEIWCADYLSWKRNTKQHYGHSICDIEGDSYKGECKNYKTMRIHTLKQEIDTKYKDDVLIFTKLKGTKFEPCNVLIHLNLEQFHVLLKCKRIAETVDKRTNVLNIENNRLTNLLKDMSYTLESVLLSYRKMKKIIKKIEEVK